MEAPVQASSPANQQGPSSTSRSAGAGEVVERGRPRPPQAETLGRSMQTILHKAGYFTPERAEELDRLAAQQAEKERRLAAAKLRAICGVLKRDQEAAFDRLEYVRQRLAAEQFQAYQRVHD